LFETRNEPTEALKADYDPLIEPIVSTLAAP